MDNIEKIMFGVIGIIITVSFFIIGVYYSIKMKKEKKYSSKVYGKIIDNSIIRKEKMTDGDGYTRTTRYYYALCEYIVGETKCIRETNIGTTQPKYKLGQTVTVYYNPNNCHESYIEGDNNSKIKAIVGFALGIVCSIFVYISMKFF